MKEWKQMNVIKRIKEFCLLDDDFMTRCFEDNIEATELVLRVILDKPDIHVEKVQTQYSMKNIKGRSLRLDIYAVDSNDKRYNIEIQKADKGAGAKRARYNSSLIDSDIMPTGLAVENLEDTYVIFITEHDVLGDNQPIYHIERHIKETNRYFEDGSHIIYVNASYQDNTELGRLMHDFTCTNPDDMHYNVIAETTRYYKEDTKGVRSMSRIVEELIDEEKREIAEKFLKSGTVSKEIIVECVGLTIEEVNELEDELQMCK
ncbi:MAG: PD-(D/E)XK nuclease family transposase [Clostridium sp.]|nr:PD-(D/E)XK nuclease family transposase [Clostridium sp.]